MNSVGLNGLILLRTRSVFDKAAEVDSDLRKSGSRIPDADVLIASVALENDLVLVTDDGHFDNILQLKAENWMRVESPGEGKVPAG